MESEEHGENGTISHVLAALVSLGIAWVGAIVVYNVFFHPLSKFPGPMIASFTFYWKGFVECVQGKSFCHVLEGLHAQYGDVVRVGPNELHFADPRAYHEIYNNKNRWDKEWRLYHSFNEDRSSFGFITYQEAKSRKDVLNRAFSPAAVEQAENLILEKIKALCAAFKRQSIHSRSSDLFYAFRCMTIDIIVSLCFGKSINAVDEPEFRAPILEAMDASTPIFVRFKYFDIYKNMILKCPPKLSKVISPSTAGLVNLQLMLLQQIKELTQDPEKLKLLPHNMTIYHRLMDAEAYRDKTVPSAGSLYEEAQTLMFAGADTVGNTLMVGTYHLLQHPEKLQRLKADLMVAWPSLANEEPKCRDLEKLPYLNAVIKESLRLSSGVVSGLLRVVPSSGATICGVVVPPGAVVSCGSTFVHYNAKIFQQPDRFVPERWLESPDLDNWLVSFSRGPRMCLGINLAWAELRLGFAHVFRKFDLSPTDPVPPGLPFRDAFLPLFYGTRLRAKLQPVDA